MNLYIIKIVLALIVIENSEPTDVGACGGVGILQETEIFYREYVRLGGTLPPEARATPLAKQIAHKVIEERLKRRGITEEGDEALRYVAWLWNSGDPTVYGKLKEAMR